MNLNNQTIETTYGNVLTIGTTAGTPTSGTLENGAGNDIASLDINGSLSVADLTIGNSLTFSGTFNAGSVTSTGPISGTTGTFTGAVDGAAGTFSSLRSNSSVEGATGTFTGAHSAASYTSTGAGTFGNVATGDVNADNITASTVINTVELNATGPSALAATTMTDLTATRGTIPTLDSTAITADTATIDTITTDNIIYTQRTVAATGTTLSAAAQVQGGVNLVSSADASNIAVKLPSPTLGTSVKIINTSTRGIEVYPYSATDSVLGLAAGTAYIIPADGLMYEFICIQNPSVGVWSVTTPTSNSGVKRTVTVNLSATPSSTFSDNNGKFSNALLDGALVTFNGVYQLRPPQTNTSYFEIPEFNTYDEVRINEVKIKTNIPAGDGTGVPAQISNTLMGITANQLHSLYGYIRQSRYDETSNTALTNNILNSYRADNFYSATIANGNTPPSYITHYLGADGLFYQEFTFTAGINPGGNAAGWQDLRDSNGNRRVYYGPYIGFGNSQTPASNYPSNFEFTAEMTIEFEMK